MFFLSGLKEDDSGFRTKKKKDYRGGGGHLKVKKKGPMDEER